MQSDTTDAVNERRACPRRWIVVRLIVIALMSYASVWFLLLSRNQTRIAAQILDYEAGLSHLNPE